MISSKIIAYGILKAIGVVVLITISLYFLYLIQSVLIYLLVAFILTLIGNPILDFFKRKLKFNHVLATVATLTVFVSIIFGFIMLFVPLLLSQSENLSLLNTTEIEKDVLKLIEQITQFLTSHNIDSKKITNAN